MYLDLSMFVRDLKGERRKRNEKERRRDKTMKRERESGRKRYTETLENTTTLCNKLLHSATRCNALHRTVQHTAIHCHTHRNNCTIHCNLNTQQHKHCGLF